MSAPIVRTLSELETRLLNSLSVDGKKIFTSDDAQAVFDGQRVNVNKLLYRLVRKKWLFRLEKGKYLILPLEAGMEGMYTLHEFVIAAHLVQPYAIAYWTALHAHGFTEQIPRTVMVASPNRRRDVGIEELGVYVRFIKIRSEKFFGLTSIRLEEQDINITDPAKTVIDCLDRLELCGGITEAAKGLWHYFRREGADPARLTEYAERMGNKTIFKRLGYLAEILELPWPDHISEWRSRLSSGMSLLDPRRGQRGAYDTRWNLRLNVEEHHLTEWMEH